jgi:3-isopropylmalate/(R)-2-methylmalate dehydratase small subunit
MLTGIAVPIDAANVDTDQIIPARFLLKSRACDFGPLLFHDLRFGPNTDPAFTLNDRRYAGARIIVGNVNFGCGSSREQAPYALWDYGIRAVIAPSFGDIFRLNCVKNGILPAEVSIAEADALRFGLREKPGAKIGIDLESMMIAVDGGEDCRFAIDARQREQLLKGEDDISRTLHHEHTIAAFERRYQSRHGWAPPR